LIISHKHRYLFIEIPLTASWAIHRELRIHYDGQPILHKHATYHEFRQQASPDELKYFVFATVRNPLDKILSTYFKIKNNQEQVFSKDNSLQEMVIDYSDLNKYQYVKEECASFEDYFKKFYRIPYSDMIDLSSRHLDWVLRYENIQDQFTGLLSKLGLEQVRPLPVFNQTPEKPREFLPYYTPAIINQAKRICGPFMKKWNYQFPDNWGSNSISPIYDIEYLSMNQLRYLYTVYLRYNNASYAVFMRKLRARLFS
jgi:hypothetical protein